MKTEALRVIREEHATMAALLRSLVQLARRGPAADGEDDSARFFDVLRATLFYLGEFPEKHHHPKESDLLFPRLLRVAPHTASAIEQLERDHQQGESRVRALVHELLAWELLGDGRKAAFVDQAAHYADFYLAHLRLEETAILPEAERWLTDADWHALNAAFATNQDPLRTGRSPREPQFDRLFTHIMMMAPGCPGRSN